MMDTVTQSFLLQLSTGNILEIGLQELCHSGMPLRGMTTSIQFILESSMSYASNANGVILLLYLWILKNSSNFMNAS